MKRALPAFFGILLSLLLLLAACTPSRPAEETTTLPEETSASLPVLPGMPESGLFGIPFAPPSGAFNPITDESQLNAAFIPLVYDSLFKPDENFRPTALLCRDHSFSQGVLTLIIKEGILFHDETELTAADAAYSLNLAKNSGGFFAKRLESFSDIRATDRYTLTMSAAKAESAALAFLDIPIIKANTGGDAIGTGRYRMQKSDELRFLSSFSAWHGSDGEAPLVPHLLLVEVEDMDALIYNLSAGNLDAMLADPLNSEEVAFLAEADRYTAETASLVYLAFNTEAQNWQNKALRQGISLLLDREMLTQALPDGAMAGQVGLFPNSANLADEAALAELAGFQPEKGLALLANAGYRPDFTGKLRDEAGRPLRLTILANGSHSAKKALAEAVAQMLAASGIEASVSAPAFEEYAAAAEKGQFDLLLAEAAFEPDFDPSFLLAENGALNFGKYKSAELTQLLADFPQTIFTENTEAAEALAVYVAENVPIAPLGFRQKVFLVRKANKLSNIRPTAFDPFDNIINWAQS